MQRSNSVRFVTDEDEAIDGLLHDLVRRLVRFADRRRMKPAIGRSISSWYSEHHRLRKRSRTSGGRFEIQVTPNMPEQIVVLTPLPLIGE
jgi:hypothetical protein